MNAARKGGDSALQIKAINTHKREIKKAAARINFARKRVGVRAALFRGRILRI